VRLREGVYSTAQIDSNWPLTIWEDFHQWFLTDPAASEYQHLNWDAELEEARKRTDEGPSHEVRL